MQDDTASGGQLTFYGIAITDQSAAPVFTRQGINSSFLQNGLRFTELYLAILLVLACLRIIKKMTGIDPFNENSNKGIMARIFCTIYTKFEYTIILTIHQSSTITFSLAVYLQCANLSQSVWVNVLSAILAFISGIYFAFFLQWVFKKTNSAIWLFDPKLNTNDRMSENEKNRLEDF